MQFLHAVIYVNLTGNELCFTYKQLSIAYLNKFYINFMHKEASINHEGYSSLCTTIIYVEEKLNFLEAHEQFYYTSI